MKNLVGNMLLWGWWVVVWLVIYAVLGSVKGLLQ
jgi:hypothetical protein